VVLTTEFDSRAKACCLEASVAERSGIAFRGKSRTHLTVSDYLTTCDQQAGMRQRCRADSTMLAVE